jgi:acetylornithine deacetylase/succinyl-diaminopimelate desuccinylase-like protein
MVDTRWAAESVDLTAALIRNACVNTGDPDSGNEIRSVRTIQAFLDSPGVVIEPHPTRASVVHRVEGTQQEAPTLLLIPHMDVVPANSADWRHHPFEAVRSDGMLWGRGAVDMLNITAAMVCVFRALRDGQLPPPVGDVILAAVADEEAGGELGANHLVDEHWDLVEADFVLTEVAGPPLESEGGPIIPVTVAEKGPAWRTMSARGTAGHGSQPFGRANAVLTLSEAFHRIGTARQPILVTEEWLQFLPNLPLDSGTKQDLANPDTVDGAIDRIADSDPILARWIHACTHLTFSPNVIVGGTKANMVADSSSGEVDVRLLPGMDATDVEDHLRKVLGPDLFEELEVVPVHEMPANGSAPEGPLWEAIEDASERHIGSRRLAPTMTPVTTDARFFRQKGIPAFGVGLFDDRISFAEMLAMFHGVDERVSTDSIVRTSHFLATVIESFGSRIGAM